MSNLFPISRRNFLSSSLAVSTYLFSFPIAFAQSTSTFNSFSFIFLSDCHLGARVPDSYKLTQESQLFLQQAIKQINLLKPDFVIFGGDQVDGPGDEDTNWQFFLDIMQSLECPWHFVLGEADISGNIPVNKMHTYGRDWRGRGLNNDQPYWSYDQLPGVHVIGMDTSVSDSLTGYVSNDQLDWLKNDLSQQNASLTLVISHHPLLAPPPFDQTSYGAQYLLPQAELIRDILMTSGKQIIALNGHVHVNKIEKQNNVSYISCPSLDVYPCAFRYFRVTKEKMEVETHQVNFPALVKKAKGNLLESNLASDITSGHPRNFVSLALGSRSDQNNSFALASIGVK
jgi:3',5'-cyclic AMP phosphodiesterase CpdA